MTTLEPGIIKYLEKNGSTHINTIIEYFNALLKINIEKIIFRINKLVSQKKLSKDNGLISIVEDGNFFPEKFDETFEKGPIKIVRKGKQIFMQSNWKEKEHEKFMESVKKSSVKLEDIIHKINDIEKQIIEKFDPLDILAYVSVKNLFGNPETYAESSFEGKQLIPEIIQNIILKNNFDKYKSRTNRKIIPEIEPPIKELLHRLNDYTLYNPILQEGFSDAEKEIYFKTVIHFLNIRGSAYPQHYKLIALELFKKINFKLNEKGFSIEEYFQTIEEIEKQINDNINQLNREHKIFIKFSDEEMKKDIEPQTILQKYLKSSEKRRKNLHPENTMMKENFEIKINDHINKKVLELLTLEFGCNNEWQSPFDKSDISIKPVVKADDKYYCFIAPHLIRNVISIIESSLNQQEKDLINYHELKGNYFEKKILTIFRKVLSNSKICPNLYYSKGEIDGIIVQGKKILLIEIKGKKKRIIAGNQDILALTKEDFKAHINEAYVQSKKALDYIKKQEIVVFKDKNKKIVLKIKKEDVEEIYLVNISIEDFSIMATDLNLVKLWDSELLKGEVYPWILNIYDLIVISDLIENQEDFMDYLKQRIKINKDYELKAGDELDFLGYYLTHGSLSKTDDIKKNQSPLIHGYSENVDKWYAYLRGEVKSAKKPAKKKDIIFSHNA